MGGSQAIFQALHTREYEISVKATRVADPDPGWVKIRIRIRDEQPISIIIFPRA
jgi:hypothetical protein